MVHADVAVQLGDEVGWGRWELVVDVFVGVGDARCRFICLVHQQTTESETPIRTHGFFLVSRPRTPHPSLRIPTHIVLLLNTILFRPFRQHNPLGILTELIQPRR